tara:strand:- start:2673 stop:4598 length:1926 start_codon:yes stop_codon:yes gene_type:complete
MFIQTRCLYVVGYERQKPEVIYSDLERLRLISKIFSSNPLEDYELIIKFLSLLPNQTIFSKTVATSASDVSAYYISLPFFSSHVKMPIKEGEYIWVYPYDTKMSNYSSYSINSYWVSRIHGLNHTEDVNFTFNDRDIDVSMFLNNLSEQLVEEENITKKARQKKLFRNHKKSVFNTIIQPKISFGDQTFELDENESRYLNNNLFSYPNNCVPQIANPADDLILQGSNSTVLKMSTTNYSNGSYTRNNSGRGEIILASGIGQKTETNVTVKSGNFSESDGTVMPGDSYSLEISENNALPVKLIYNNLGFSENIKNHNLYSFEEIGFNYSNQGASSLRDDSSKIVISEMANYDNSINQNFNTFLNLSFFEEEKTNSEVNAGLMDIKDVREDKKFNINNFKPESSSINDSDMPSISMISNNIGILSRFGEGSINLSKEYYSNEAAQSLNAFVRIDEEGNVYIDGDRIFIGSSMLEKAKGTFNNGTGSIVNIGGSEESQSLVLGEQLKEYMNEIIDINIEDMDLTKKLFEHVRDTQADMDATTFSEIEFALNNTVSNVAQGLISIPPKAGQAAAAIPDILSIINNFAADLLSAINSASNANSERLQRLTDEIVLAKLKKEEELSNRIKTISDNIDKILSKISKTS